RGRHTRFSRDWSSDVCSSDLVSHEAVSRRMSWIPLPPISSPVSLRNTPKITRASFLGSRSSMTCVLISWVDDSRSRYPLLHQGRSEERRVGRGARCWLEGSEP